MITFLTAALIQTAFSSAEQARDRDIIAVCALKPNGGQSATAKVTLALQFDSALMGPVAQDAVQIYDPGSLLSNRQISRVGLQSGTFILAATAPGTTSMDEASIVGLQLDKATKVGDTKMLPGAITRVSGKSVEVTHSGNCSVLLFSNGGSNAYFESLKATAAKRAERGQ